jgi:dolichyl-phosphate beta-glucosyltransferase
MQKTCIIVPCFNEAARLPVEDFRKYISGNPTIYFLFVNDGSTDNTLEVLVHLQQSAVERLRVVSVPQNAGKAEAVRFGIKTALTWSGFAYIGYFDADLATPLDQINYMMSHSNDRDYHIIMGTRLSRLGSLVKRKNVRHVFGRLLSTFISIILKVPVYDSQCGAKLLSFAIAEKISEEKFISRWLFDVEILARSIYHLGRSSFLQSAIEIPLEQWIEKKGSKIKPSYLIKIPFDLWKIYVYFRRKKSERLVKNAKIRMIKQHPKLFN